MEEKALTESSCGAGQTPVYGPGQIARYGSGQTPVFQDAGPEPRHQLGPLRARYWTPSACLVVVITLAAAWTGRTTPIYEASARLLIERRVPQLTPFEGVQERRDETYAATEVKLIASRAVLEEALKDEKLAELFKDTSGLDVSRPSLLGRALREVRGVFGSEPTRRSEPWERLRGVLEVEPVRGTDLVDVKVEGAGAERNALIANAVAKAYVDYSVTLRQESAFDTFEMLQGVRKEQENALTGAEGALLAYWEQTTTPHLGSPEESAVGDRLKALNDEYAKVQMRRMELSVAAKAIEEAENDGHDVDSLLAIREIREDPDLNGLLQFLRGEYRAMQVREIELNAAAEAIAEAQESGGEISSLLAIGLVRSDPTVREVCDRLTQVEMDIGAALRTYGEEHPHLVGLRGQREYLLSRLGNAVSGVVKSIKAEHRLLVKREKAQKEQLGIQLPETVRSAAKAIETEHKLLVQREKEITGALREENRVALEQARKSHGYQRLKRDMERQSRVFDAIVDRMKAVDLSKDVGVSNVSLVDPATVPRTPIKPNKKRALLLGVVLGLLLGVGMAYVLEYLDDTVKTPEDVERGLGMPWLGYVPEMEAEGTGRDGMAERATHALMSPSSSTTESFRSIRTNIYYSGEKDEIRSLVVTSALPQEGKTVFATNLATTVAQDGKRVLLVDADLRRPGIHNAFGLERAPGLTSLLVEGTPLEELVQAPPEGSNGELENLHILTAGPKTPNPAELLGGEAMARFVREAREKYDMVIFDAAPAMFVADAAALTSGSDGVIMILKTAKTRRGSAARARKQLEAVKGKIIGAVLNAVRPRTLRGYGYYRYGYGYYYYDYHRYYEEYAHDERKEKRRRGRKKTV